MTICQSLEIFVFGSNEAGIHGAGSAKVALKNHGAIFGKGIGLQGQSYGIPTKDRDIDSLPLKDIKHHVNDFIYFAKLHPHWAFNIVAIGCGLAGFTPDQIAPMFKDAPKNCVLPNEFKNGETNVLIYN